MKQFNPKLINFKIVLTLSLLTMSGRCPKEQQVQQGIIDQYRAWKNNKQKDRLEEKDQKEMVKKFKNAVDQVDTKSDKNGSSSIGPLLKWLNMYTEEVKRKFFALEAYDGYTLFGYAIVKNSYNVVKELLKERSINIRELKYKGTETGALQLALARESLYSDQKTENKDGKPTKKNPDRDQSIVLLLLENARWHELDFTKPIPKTKDTTILHVAVQKVYLTVVKALLKCEDKIKPILNNTYDDDKDKTALNIVIANCLKYYDYFKNEDQSGKNSKREGLYGPMNHHRYIIAMLLELGTLNLDVVQTNDWIKFIDKEVTDGKEDLIKLLAKHPAFENSAIHKALDEGLEKDEYWGDNEYKDGLLHKAVRDKKLHKVRILTTYFPYIVNAQNGQEKNNDTALHIAVSNDKVKSGDIVIVEELLKVKDIDVNIKNNSGDTPLHFAAYCESEAIAQILVNNLANKTIQNNDGLTPYGIVEQRIQRSNRSWGLNKPVLKVLYPDKN